MSFSLEDVADRAGVEPGYLDELIGLGIVGSGESGELTSSDVRRVLMAGSLDDAGIPLGTVADAMKRGALSLDFVASPAYERFGAYSSETFREVSDRTGIPIELLTVIRESSGSAPPTPDDRMREDEMNVVPFIQFQVEAGFDDDAIIKLLRVYGDCANTVAESEGAWWNSEIIEPAIASGKDAEDVVAAEFAVHSTELAEQAFLALYHTHQARVWTGNIIEGFEVLMAREGIHSRLQRPPAMCFLDITGYTRLAQERGDDAAARTASDVARLVQQISASHKGRLVKRLGDGVMFYFRDAGSGVRAAIEMVERLATAGLPPAHVGLHAGPVLFQEGDYFGQTVNLAARIADYARPGEVLVSKAVADLAREAGIRYSDVGQVELKGVSGVTHLLVAHLDLMPSSAITT